MGIELIDVEILYRTVRTNYCFDFQFYVAEAFICNSNLIYKSAVDKSCGLTLILTPVVHLRIEE